NVTSFEAASWGRSANGMLLWARCGAGFPISRDMPIHSAAGGSRNRAKAIAVDRAVNMTSSLAHPRHLARRAWTPEWLQQRRRPVRIAARAVAIFLLVLFALWLVLF